jgi:hypothetical protein
MDLNLEDKTSSTIKYEEAFLKYVKNEYCAKHRHMLVNKLHSLLSSNPIPSAMASGPCLSFIDPYDLSNDHDEY